MNGDYHRIVCIFAVVVLTLASTVIAMASAPENNSSSRHDTSGQHADLSTFGNPSAGRLLRSFTDIGAGLPAVYHGSVRWGDYDNDADLDLLLTGWTGSESITRIYRNDGADGFNAISAGLPGVRHGVAEWGDYDSDGDLDIVLTGLGDAGRLARVYRNGGDGVFADIDAELAGVSSGDAAWGDFDNDGDLDIVLAGSGVAGPLARVYRNDGAGIFLDIGAGLPGVWHGATGSWSDYDNDGDLDILLTGYAYSGSDISRIYRNDGDGSFVNSGVDLADVRSGATAWGDCDNDGDLDLLLTGDRGAGYYDTHVYRNEGDGTFTDSDAGLPAVRLGSVAWADYDNDGNLDIVLTGDSGSGNVGYVFRSDGDWSFTDIGAGLPGVRYSSVAWGDFDNDGDLDLVLTGYTGPDHTSRIYRNDGSDTNTVPEVPTNLAVQTEWNQARLSWNPSADGQTPAAGLSYNVRVGTTPGGSDVLAPMAATAGGQRFVVQLGNAQQRTFHDLVLPGGLYFWSVQAVDGAYAGSAFAAEGSFRVVTFNDSGVELQAVYRGFTAWGDYDGDEDLDLLLVGQTTINHHPAARIYRNDGAGAFTDIEANLVAVGNCSGAWGDCDNDGDLDLVLAGRTDGGVYATRVFRNEGDDLFTYCTSLIGAKYSSVDWGDFDNDGDLDLVLTGGSADGEISIVYRNQGDGTFIDIEAAIVPVSGGAASWGDYDNDGDLDILLTGSGDDARYAKVYRNDCCGVFTDIAADLPGVESSTSAWGDYDNDGDLDILLAGDRDDDDFITCIYRNDGSGVFTDIAAGLPGIHRGAVDWGDYDNDGDLDILLTGESADGKTTRIARNDGDGEFTLFGDNLTDLALSSVDWGDYDGDGDLDFLLMGFTDGPLQIVTRLYRNGGTMPNTVPLAPTEFSANLSGTVLSLGWNQGADNETPTSGLTYNLRVGITAGGTEIMSAMADGATGWRTLPAPGNVCHNLAWTIESPLLLGTDVYWSVQALDTSFTGSVFGPEQFVDGTVGTGPAATPDQLALHGNVPNPFNPTTTIVFDLPVATSVELALFDVSGHRIRTLVADERNRGRHSVVWDGRNDRGEDVASGIYLCRLRAGSRSLTQQLTLVR